MDFWERLKNGVKENNTTQEWIAKEIGIPFGTLRKWLSRKTMPNADQAVAIARALNTTVEEMVTGESCNDTPPQLRSLFLDLEKLDDQDIAEIQAIVSVKLAAREAKTNHA